MFELFLSKTPNKEASPATARQARHTTEKYSLLFSFCAPPISFPFLKRNGNGSRRAKIPSPQPPSFLPACLGFAPKTFRRDGGIYALEAETLLSFRPSIKTMFSFPVNPILFKMATTLSFSSLVK